MTNTVLKYPNGRGGLPAVADGRCSEDQLRDQIDTALQRIIGQARLCRELKAAVDYSILGGGKRLRPLVALNMIQDLGFDPAPLAPVAALIELFHGASLVHDDLPALDDDALRRGKPTAHKVFGESTALLAGDVLVPFAFEALHRAEIAPEVGWEVMGCLSKAYRMTCNGQQLDLLPHGDLTDLHKLHQEKTGSLFMAAAELPLILLRAPREIRRAGACFGLWLGVSYQIGDDFLDVYGSAGEKGRGQGSDERNEKTTFFSCDSEGRHPWAAEGLTILDGAGTEINNALQVIVSHFGLSREALIGTSIIVDRILGLVRREDLPPVPGGIGEAS